VRGTTSVEDGDGDDGRFAFLFLFLPFAPFALLSNDTLFAMRLEK
jgi:hypothetical protein